MLRYMSVPGIFECYSKPLTILDFEALKDEPLIELDTIGLKGSPRTSSSPLLLPRRVSVSCWRVPTRQPQQILLTDC